MCRPRIIILSLLILFLLGSTSGPLLGNGGKGKKTDYEGRVPMQEGFVKFSTELERIRFRLNSVHGKYKVIRIKIENDSSELLRLSSKNDKIEIDFGDRVVSGILRLGTHDPGLWDSFDADLREDLVYPQIVESWEEENIFVFIPVAGVNRLPLDFSYMIHSLPDHPVTLSESREQAEL
ncbi:MAG: hypothetical protein GY856_49205 [bacterium]|nr:hypothetical protein [bacterium]